MSTIPETEQKTRRDLLIIENRNLREANKQLEQDFAEYKEQATVRIRELHGQIESLKGIISNVVEGIEPIAADQTPAPYTTPSFATAAAIGAIGAAVAGLMERRREKTAKIVAEAEVEVAR